MDYPQHGIRTVAIRPQADGACDHRAAEIQMRPSGSGKESRSACSGRSGGLNTQLRGVVAGTPRTKPDLKRDGDQGQQTTEPRLPSSWKRKMSLIDVSAGTPSHHGPGQHGYPLFRAVRFLPADPVGETHSPTGFFCQNAPCTKSRRRLSGGEACAEIHANAMPPQGRHILSMQQPAT